MNKNSVAHLFKEPAQWPFIPPWWLVSTPQAAALLNMKPATLQHWRVRGEGPEPVPPMYLRPTQGDPVYYIYANIRSWAAQRLGLSYSIHEQCYDFFNETMPILNRGEAPWRGRAKTFDMLFKQAHVDVRKKRKPRYLTIEQLQKMDLYYSKQPNQLLSVIDLVQDGQGPSEH